MIASFVGLMLASATVSSTEPQLTSGPIKMKNSEIRAYNARLARDDPHYIRCARVGETGSLVKKSSVCRTNEEWRRVETMGNDDARLAVEGVQKGWTNGR